MKMMKYYLMIFILNAFFFISCSGSLPEPTSEQIQWASVKWPGITIKELSEGRDLYINKCSGCHSLNNPADYTMEEWDKWLVKMKPKAKLNEAEYEKIRYFVMSASKK